MKKKTACAGVTLIEMILVMAIIGVLFAIGTVALGNMEREDHLTRYSSEIKAKIYLAQAQTINGVSTGIHFEVDNYTLFYTPTYQPGEATNEVISLPSSLSFLAINLFSDAISFDPVSGYVNDYVVPCHVSLTENGTGKTKLITINSYGLVTVQ